jgi:peptidoglycan hydrolase CwlO-like protein
MIEQLIALGGWVVSVITTIVTFVVAKHKRHDDDIVIMQERIVDLLDKNDRFINQIVELRKENAMLKANLAQMQEEINTLRQKVQHSTKTNKRINRSTNQPINQ